MPPVRSISVPVPSGLIIGCLAQTLAVGLHGVGQADIAELQARCGKVNQLTHDFAIAPNVI